MDVESKECVELKDHNHPDNDRVDQQPREGDTIENDDDRNDCKQD